jgi:GntR family transcriptional regulator/MocR family aminotransferase
MRNIPLAEWLQQTSDPHAKGAPPLNRWLSEAIRQTIVSGRLKAGLRLPPTRKLALELGMARITVLQAYERLASEGYLVSKVGAGTFVSDTKPDPTLLIDAQHGTVRRTPSSQFTPSRGAQRVLSRLGVSPKQLGAFTPGIPDIDNFPYAIWQKILAKAGRERNAGLSGYGTSHGLPALRHALVDYLSLSRGVRCTAEQIVITHGAHQALDLCIRALCDAGDTAWMEDPVYWGARNLLAINAVQTLSLPLDSQGMQLPVQTLGAPPKLIFVTPSHQYPSGVVMSLARRRLWIELAARHNAYIIEDDYDSEFRYREAPLPSLQGLDHHQRTLYIGSFSKTLYPGLRLGFVVAPPSMTPTLAALHSELYRGGQLVLQTALAEFIAEGHFSAHVRRMRRVYAERQAVLSEALRRHLGDKVSIPDDPAGLHLAVGLHGVRDQAVSDAALALELVARPLSAYYDKPAQAPQGLVLGFGGIQIEEIEGAVQLLARAVEKAQSSTMNVND